MNNGEFTDFELKIPVNRALRWVGIVGIVFSLWMAFLAKLNNEGIGYLVAFIGFSLLGLLVFLLSFSTLQVSHKSIAATILYTKYKIEWDEVRTIETDVARMLGETDWDTGSTIAFLGSGKCFPVEIGTLGKGKTEFLEFVQDLIDKRQIEVKPLSSAWMKHKNTKVKGSGS